MCTGGCSRRSRPLFGLSRQEAGKTTTAPAGADEPSLRGGNRDSNGEDTIRMDLETTSKDEDPEVGASEQPVPVGKLSSALTIQSVVTISPFESFTVVR